MNLASAGIRRAVVSSSARNAELKRGLIADTVMILVQPYPKSVAPAIASSIAGMKTA